MDPEVVFSVQEPHIIQYICTKHEILRCIVGPVKSPAVNVFTKDAHDYSYSPADCHSLQNLKCALGI